MAVKSIQEACARNGLFLCLGMDPAGYASKTARHSTRPYGSSPKGICASMAEARHAVAPCAYLESSVRWSS
jgi:hypothetical protein